MIDSSHLESLLGSKAKIRVLDVLFKSRDELLTGREVARRAGLTAARTHTILKTLVSGGVATVLVSGRNHMYSLKPEPELMSLLERLFSTPSPSLLQRMQDAAAQMCANTGIVAVKMMSEDLFQGIGGSSAARLTVIVEDDMAAIRSHVRQLVEHLTLVGKRPVAAEVYTKRLLPEIIRSMAPEVDMVSLYGSEWNEIMGETTAVPPKKPRGFSFRRLIGIDK